MGPLSLNSSPGARQQALTRQTSAAHQQQTRTQAEDEEASQFVLPEIPGAANSDCTLVCQIASSDTVIQLCTLCAAGLLLQGCCYAISDPHPAFQVLPRPPANYHGRDGRAI